MTKALFKKQIMEVFSFIYFDRKNSKSRSKGGIIGFAILYLLIFAALGFFFFGIASMLCGPLAEAGFGWLYIALMGLITVTMGVFGSVFSTYSSLYTAKDNDLLLSLPIPSGRILAIRLMGIYLMGLIYELVIAIPTLIVYFMTVKQTALSVVINILIPIVLSFLSPALSCILGFLVALIGSKTRSKNAIIVVLSLVFFGAYYFVCMRAYQIVQSILLAPEKLGDSIKSIFYPFYHMGLGAEGNVVSFLIFACIVMAICVLTYLVLQKSFISIATANKGTSKKLYKEKKTKAASIEKALLIKELRRFVGCPIYMLNCGLSIAMMPVAAVVLLIKGADISEVIYGMFGENTGVTALLAAAVIGLLCTMNDITSPSVSLEGKNIWILQSLPVSTKKVLHAKIKLHLILTIIPAVFLAVCIFAVFKIPPVYSVMVLVFVISFIVLTALMGLALNLKMPNLSWTDATVPVKQSLCVLIALFGGWAIIMALSGIFFLVMKFLTPLVYLILVSVLLLLVSALILKWIDTKGVKIFETL